MASVNCVDADGMGVIDDIEVDFPFSSHLHSH